MASNDPIASFVAELGFKADLGAAKRTVEVQAQVEAAYTKAATEGAAKREAIEAGATAKRIGLAEGLNKLVLGLEQDRADRAAKIKKDEAAQDEKLQAEREKRAKERRAAAVKDLQTYATRMATFALKTVGAVEAVALGIVYAVDRASKSMERLGYASQRAGSTPGKMTATSYAFSQLGSTAEAGQSAVSALGEKLKTPGYDRYLKSIGVEARKANGELRVTDDILADLGEALAKKQKEGGASGYRIAQAHAEALGLNVDQMQTIEDPRYTRMYAERQAIDAKMGTDQGAGAEEGSKFETSTRRLEATIDSLKTKVATDLAKNIQPTLDKLANWAADHGQEISDAIVKVADGIIRLANTVIDNLSKINWDAIIRDVSDFGDKLDKKMSDLFGDDGKMVLALAGFAALVGSKVLKPLGLVLKAVEAIGALPLVGRLLGGAAGSTAGLTVAAVTAGGVADAEMARRTGQAMTGGDPNAKFDPETGFVNDLDFGYGDKGKDETKPSGGAWSWIKSKLGLGDADPDAKRVKDAILQTAEGVKKLADNAGGMGGGMGGGGGGSFPGGTGGATPGSESGASGGEGGTRSWRNNNPGNLKYGPFAQRLGATGKDGAGFAIFPSYEAGRRAQEALWFDSPGYKDKTLAQAVARWSPPGENDTAGIVKQYAAAVGVDPNTPLSQFTPEQRRKLLDAQQAREGWRAGTRSGPGSVGSGDIIAKAEGMVGLREGQAAQALGHIMHAGEWCADFVNGMIEKNGGKGSGNAMARSFMHWGKAVGLGDVKRGDVAVLNGGGHVGFFTGERTADGRMGVIAGNTRDGRGGHDVEHYFVDPRSVYGARRGEEAQAQVVKAAVAEAVKQAVPAAAPVAAKAAAEAVPRVTDEQYKAALARLPGFQNRHLSAEEKAQSHADDVLIDRYHTQGSGAVKVEITDGSAAKIGKAATTREKLLAEKADSDKRLASTQAAAASARAHLAATQAVLRSHRGHVLGVDPHSMLGRHIRQSIDNSRRSVSIIHNPSYTMNGVADPAAALSDAHRLAGRGQADLIRNLSTMTS